MAKDLEKIEIHSDKVRNIMGEEPPIVIRYGTSIIAVLLLTMAIITFNVIT